MDQEKIGKIIKEIRKKENLTQEKFAFKYGVTFQAVSKWENGKSIPDILILKEICKDYGIDLNDILDTKIKRHNKKYVGLIVSLLLIISCFVTLKIFTNSKFVIESISTKNKDFNLYGQVAYNNKVSFIHISNITYQGNDSNKYQKIKCTLYETKGKTKIELANCDYKKKDLITMQDFLKQLDFKVNNSKKICEPLEKDRYNLEIEASTSKGETTFYKVPLKIEEIYHS